MDEVEALRAKVRKAAKRKKLLRVGLAAALGALVVLNPELASVLGPVVGTL